MTASRVGRLAATAGVAAALVAGSAWALDRSGLPVPGLGPDCVLATAAGELDLDRDEAMAATTVAARAEADGADDGATAARVAAALAGDGGAGDGGAGDGGAGAADVVAALRGRDGPALSCRSPAGRDIGPEQATGDGGLTPRAQRLREGITEAFGEQSLGGFAPGGVSTGHIEGSAHYDGRAIDVFFRPVSAENRRAGWVLAQWLVAHSEEYEVATVIFDDSIWSARRSGQGWRDYVHPSGDRENEILRHLDHVHVDVARGRG